MIEFDKYTRPEPAIEAVRVRSDNLFDVCRLIGADRFEVFNLNAAVPAAVFKKDYSTHVATVEIGRYLVRRPNGSFTTMSSQELHSEWEAVE